jgi:hypothetical protein
MFWWTERGTLATMKVVSRRRSKLSSPILAEAYLLIKASTGCPLTTPLDDKMTGNLLRSCFSRLQVVSRRRSKLSSPILA